MSRPRREYSPRRAGEVVDVRVVRADPRPVKVALFDHHHRYEFAWTHTENGPIVTDLRITSDDGAPITSNSVKRIPVERLAKTAALYDTPEAAELGRDLREALVPVLDRYNGDPEAYVADACSWLEATGDPDAAEAAQDIRRAVVTYGAAQVVADALDGVEQRRIIEDAFRRSARRRQPRTTNTGGRPTEWTPEFLERVAQLAIEAVRQGRSVYEWVASRASAELGYDVTVHQVKWWIKQCKEAQPPLLSNDQLRRPRKRRATAPDEGKKPAKRTPRPRKKNT